MYLSLSQFQLFLIFKNLHVVAITEVLSHEFAHKKRSIFKWDLISSKTTIVILFIHNWKHCLLNPLLY